MVGLNMQFNYTPFNPTKDLLLLAARAVDGMDDDDMDDVSCDCGEILGFEESEVQEYSKAAVDDSYVYAIVGAKEPCGREIVRIDLNFIKSFLDENGFKWTQDFSPDYSDPEPYHMNLYFTALLYLTWISPLTCIENVGVEKVKRIDQEEN